MKKMIPAAIAVVLIIFLGLGMMVMKVFEKYSYSEETMNLTEYYEITQEDRVPVILQDEQIEITAKLKEGTYYLDFDSVQELLNDRFFEDPNEGWLLYTTPNSIIRSQIGSNSYLEGTQETKEAYRISFYEGDTLYVALDYIKKYTNFSYETFTDPHRMQLRTQWGEAQIATVKKNTQVRYQGGVKSPILRQVEKGEQVTVLEEMENWTKVKTQDAMIGYIPNKHLKDVTTVTETPVTEYEEPEYTSQVREHKINLGWHQVMVEGANATLAEVVANTKDLNVISPTWFSLSDNQGGIRSIAGKSYVEQAHSMGLEVWALIDNFDENVSTYEVLSYTGRRETLIKNIMDQVLQYGIDGVNVDFEELSYETGEPFIQFIRELSVACRANGIVLSVDNYVPRESTAHYHRKEQGVVADYVIIMGYDEHWGGGGVAGSVASIGFVEDGIVQTLEEVPSHKVINALPFYTRVWKTQDNQVTSEAVGMEVADNFIANNNVPVRWDEAACQNYGETQLGNTLYQVWLEDAQSIETKLTIMQKYDLGGVAAWKLGFEKPEIWDLISAYVNLQ